MTVPYAFGSATTSIPLSELDANFNTPITIGNTAVQLGNTVTTLNNMTLANATVSSGNVTVTSASLSGNLTFTGTGNRITGDFSNATIANRVAFQTSTVNSNTGVGILPNGTATASFFIAYNNSDPTNAGFAALTSTTVDNRLTSGISGTGSYLPMTFLTGGSERMRIDTSGNVGIGTSSPVRQLAVGTPNGGVGTAINIGSGTSSLGTLEFGDGATGDDRFRGYVQYSHTDNSLRFGTDATERARIDSSGNLLVGTTSGAQKLVVSQAASAVVSGYFISSSATTAYGIQVTYTGKAPNNTGEEFIYCNDTSAARFVARSNGGLANYSANNVNLSDRREKTNFAPAKSYLKTICAIPVQTFNYIDQNHEEDPGLTLGVVAQDVQEVAPELVMESNWGSKEEPKMRLSVYQTDLQYALMKCIQEQQQMIETLQAEVAALKGA